MRYHDPDVPQDFLMWEATSRDTIDFKKIYVDMTGDLIAGLMLSQIVFWYLPDRQGQSKLRVQREGRFWLAKARHEWWDECRITLEQVKRATKLLVEQKLVVTRRFKFAGAPTTHIRINWPIFMQRWNEIMESYLAPLEWSDSRQSNGVIPTNPIEDKPPINQREVRRSITETTNTDHRTKKTTETTTTPTGSETRDLAAEQAGGGVPIEETDIYLFLTEKCGIWETKARQLVEYNRVSLEPAAHWWAVLKGDDNIRNRAAVLVHHLESQEAPPDFTDQRQRHRFQQYVWEYTEEVEDAEEDEVLEE